MRKPEFVDYCTTLISDCGVGWYRTVRQLASHQRPPGSHREVDRKTTSSFLATRNLLLTQVRSVSRSLSVSRLVMFRLGMEGFAELRCVPPFATSASDDCAKHKPGTVRRKSLTEQARTRS